MQSETVNRRESIAERLCQKDHYRKFWNEIKNHANSQVKCPKTIYDTHSDVDVEIS